MVLPVGRQVKEKLHPWSSDRYQGEEFIRSRKLVNLSGSRAEITHGDHWRNHRTSVGRSARDLLPQARSQLLEGLETSTFLIWG